MNKENNFELNKFCPNCKTSLSLRNNNAYYYCGDFNCKLKYYYYYNEDRITIEEFISGYGSICLINTYKANFDEKYYQYFFHEPNMSSHEILEKYNEFKENLIFL